MRRFLSLRAGLCLLMLATTVLLPDTGWSNRNKSSPAKTTPQSAAAARAQAEARFASIVIDAYTGTVLQERNADKVLYPASLTKIMTMFMAFEALDKGRIKLNQTLPVSSHAAGMAPSKLGLRPGETITVENTLYAIATKSANDAVVVLAEALGGGSETQFARMMTERARQIGMVSSEFRNASGLPNRYQKSSARDMATLARTLLARYPEYYHYFSTREFTYNGITHRNHNKLLGKYAGMDGIKTGFINASGFNLVASAERNGRRLIGVIFGGTSSQSRNNQMVSLLDNGFADAGAKNIRLASNDPGRKKKTEKNDKNQSVKSPEKPVEKQIMANRNDDSMPSTTIRQIAAKTDPENSLDNDPGENAPAPAPRREDGLTPTADRGNTSYWSIQVGAYNDQKGSIQAIESVRRLAPKILGDAASSIVPITTGRGTLYRARLAGFEESEAHKACAAVQKANIPCMPLRSTAQ